MQLAKTTEDILVGPTLTVGAMVAMVMPGSLAVHSSGEEDFPLSRCKRRAGLGRRLRWMGRFPAIACRSRRRPDDTLAKQILKRMKPFCDPDANVLKRAACIELTQQGAE
jgi:hypothetical protein